MNDTNLQHTKLQTERTAWAWICSVIHGNVSQLKKNFLPISYTLFLLGFLFFPSSKSHSTFFYVFVGFPFLILIFRKKVAFPSFFSSRTFLLSTIFLVYMFSALFWADNYELSDISKNGRRVLYILIFLGVTMHLIQVHPNFLQRLLLLLCWTAAITAIGYIMFFYSQHPFPSSRLGGYGLLYNPIEASSIYGMVFVVCVYVLGQQRSVKMRLLYWGILPALFSYILLAQSRGPLLALAVTIFAWQVLAWLLHEGGKDNHRNRLLVVLLLIFAASVASFVYYPEFFKSFFLRESYRLETWGKVLVRVTDAPFFGHGLNADSQTIMSDGFVMLHPHSIYLATLYYGGIVGLFLLVALIGLAIWQGVARIGKPQSFLLTCMVMFGALCMVTDGKTLIQHPKPFWIFFWFPIALISASELPGNLLRDEKRTTTGGGGK